MSGRIGFQVRLLRDGLGIRHEQAGQTLWDVVMATADQAWAVGSGGVIVYTADGGETWQEAESPTTKALRALHLYNPDPWPQPGYQLHGWARVRSPSP